MNALNSGLGPASLEEVLQLVKLRLRKGRNKHVHPNV